MKRLIYRGVIGLFAMMSIGTSKKDNEPLSPPVQSTITTNGERLIFESVDDYKRLVSNPNEEEQVFLSKIAALKYDNYFSTLPSTEASRTLFEPEMDDFLGQLLNKVGGIQIGKHLFRVDVEHDEVFVLDAMYKVAADYDDGLKNNKENKHIKFYSAKDDASLLADNQITKECTSSVYPCYNKTHQGQIIATISPDAVWRLNQHKSPLKS